MPPKFVFFMLSRQAAHCKIKVSSLPLRLFKHFQFEGVNRHYRWAGRWLIVVVAAGFWFDIEFTHLKHSPSCTEQKVLFFAPRGYFG
jgi:hypothetical protein